MVDDIASTYAQTSEVSTLAAKQQWREFGLHSFIRIVIVGGLFYYVFHDEIGSIVHRWRTDSSWSHGFLIPLFSLYFLNLHREKILNIEARPNYLGLVLLIFAIVIYIFNTVSNIRYGYLRSMSVLGGLGAVVLFLGGWRLVKYSWLPILFLFFAVPLPDRIYDDISLPMRQWAAAVATGLLNVIPELDATVRGVVIEILYQAKPVEPPLNVAEACSGMRLLTAFLALGVAMAYLHYRPIWQRLVLLCSTIPIAILCNIVRVTVTGFIYVLIDQKYTKGVYHDTLGLAMLPLAFGLYGLLAWFMSSLFVEETEAVKADVVVRKGTQSQ